ncbi:2-oxoacid:acceptor oxidoreductase family protein [Desulforhopalus vacuolatus]|uniref:2-oxoacid:acceptor oxidoreductase family protein n=1 Tax=Desulforhopalus vacuolatus TaxID=40414 RepID=UPI001962C67B|nr:2-oxoacid:acceptor oxidoreductase family protein [Desulforhopalus vacuolatus]MBM9519218.1 2-oxoacid:acceptor oxidoreductase family protein [Desulforhopalus vacuolatus]
MERTRIVFSGSGGQGVITAAIILAEAAVIKEGMEAVQSQSYGAAARGGATRSDIILSDEPINYPGILQPDILVCLTQSVYTQYAGIIRPGGLLLTDPRFVKPAKEADAYQVCVPIYDMVMEKIGKPIVFNISMLGTLFGIRPLFNPDSLMEVIAERVPKGFVELNKKAFTLGLELGEKYRQNF